MADAVLVLPAVLPSLPVPEDFAGELADAELEVVELAGLVAGGDGDGDLGAFTLAELAPDGQGELDPAAALAPSGGLAGGALATIPGAGVLLLGLGDGLTDVDAEGGAEVVGVVEADGVVDGGGVPEPVVTGLELADGRADVQVGAGLGALEWPGEVVRAPEPASEPPLAPPALPPPPWLEPLFEEPSAEELEVGETTCGSSVTAKPPAATTKTAMPMPATGRIQPYRGRAWPGLAGAGRKRSMTAQKAATTGSIQRRSQAAVPADQAEADSKDSIGRFSRSLIRCSPSADGSIESAAACSARRRASS